MKKILFIIRKYDMPSSRVRVTNLLKGLQKKGYDIECIEYPKKLIKKIKLFTSLNKYDIVYLQKKLPDNIEQFFIKKYSKKLIFDFDDAIYLKHENSKKSNDTLHIKKFNNIAKKSDLIIAGNRILAEYASKFNSNIEITPSTVEIDVPTRNYDIKNEKFIIGWVGGNVNLPQLALLSVFFQNLSKEIPIELRIISGKSIEIEGVDIKFIPWSEKTQEEEIAKFDIGIMPLPDSPHARGKCAFKAIQYMASGVVPIVSDVGVNADVVIHNETGLIAKEMKDFSNHIKYLYANKNILKKMGKNARERIIKNYSIDIAIEKLEKIFNSL